MLLGRTLPFPFELLDDSLDGIIVVVVDFPDHLLVLPGSDDLNFFGGGAAGDLLGHALHLLALGLADLDHLRVSAARDLLHDDPLAVLLFWLMDDDLHSIWSLCFNRAI